MATAALGSFVAGTFATLMLMMLAPVLVELALEFGPAEYFALISLGGLLGGSRAKGALATVIGLALGTVGIDVQTGQPRFTFGVPGLLGGVNVAVATVGMFAVGEVFWFAATRQVVGGRPAPVAGGG